jgi:hypothetical protein
VIIWVLQLMLSLKKDENQESQIIFWLLLFMSYRNIVDFWQDLIEIYLFYFYCLIGYLETLRLIELNKS